MRRFTAFFQIVLGTGMIGIWLMLYVTNQIPELETEPVRIAMHIAAELTTGILLLLSGFYLLVKSDRHGVLFYLSFGALIYTLIASPGYYAGQGNLAVFAAFMAMLLLSVLLIILNSRRD